MPESGDWAARSQESGKPKSSGRGCGVFRAIKGEMK